MRETVGQQGVRSGRTQAAQKGRQRGRSRERTGVVPTHFISLHRMWPYGLLTARIERAPFSEVRVLRAMEDIGPRSLS